MVDNRDRNEIVGSGPDRSAAARAEEEEEYWTPERRAAARPISLPPPSQEEIASQAEQATPPPPEAGQSGHLPPAPPSGEQNDENASTTDRESEQPDLSAGGNPVPGPLMYPYTTSGKLFFTQGGQGFAGSASVVAPNILLTAGHCVFSGGNWSQNVAFYRLIQAAVLRTTPTSSLTPTSPHGRRGPRTATGPTTTGWFGSTIPLVRF